MSIGAIMSIAGIGLSLLGASKQSDAAENQANAQAANVAETAKFNAAVSRYDAVVSRGEAKEAYYRTNRELANARQERDLFLSAQRTRFAKSGVAVGTGTPLETMARTYDEILEDERIIRYEGLKNVQRAESLAGRYELLAEGGLKDASAQASLIMSAGQDRSTAAWINGLTTATSQTYQLGSDQGWWV